MKSKAALKIIQSILSDKEWSPDTLNEIADVMRDSGFLIEESEDGDVCEKCNLPFSMASINGGHCMECGTIIVAVLKKGEGYEDTAREVRGTAGSGIGEDSGDP